MQSQSSSQSQTNQGGQFTKTISGEILKVDGNIFYVQDPSGKEIRLRLDQSAEQSGDLKKGDTIIKYGEDIGKMIKDAKKGEHVHVQNLKTKRW